MNRKKELNVSFRTLPVNMARIYGSRHVNTCKTVALAAMTTLAIACFTAGCGQNRASAKRQAIDAVARQEMYTGITNSLSTMVDNIESGASLLALQPLEQQAVLECLLNAAKASKPAYSLKTIQPKGLHPGYAQKEGYFREPTARDELSTQLTGTLKSSSAGRDFRLDILGTAAYVGGEVETFTGGDGQQYSLTRGGIILAAGSGQTAMDRASFDDAMTNSTVSGIRGSIVVSEFDNNCILVETQLPQDRVPIYSPYIRGRPQMQVVLPTGVDTIYGIRGTVHNLFPGVTVHANDDQIVYVALLSDFGLSYLAGTGELTTGAGKVSFPPIRSKR